MWHRTSLAYAVFIGAALSGCAYHPENRQTVVEGDFLEPATLEARSTVRSHIDSLKETIGSDPSNAELHRQLAVLYRLEGTPRSRLLSIEEIDHAISLDPTNPNLYVEKGLTLVARRFVGEAQACFLRATQLNKLCFEAWFQLGRMEQYEFYKTMCFPDHLVASIDYFEKAYRLNRKHEETLINLGFLYAFRHMYGTGLEYARKAVIYYPKNYRSHLLAGMLHTRLKEFNEAQKDFASALLLMSDDERKPYENIVNLLTPEERELYLSMMPNKRADWNRRFWIESDPTPATDVNERQLEHLTRVVIADWTLSDERLGLRGSQTDRGGALIRYGIPDKTFYDLGTGTSGGWLVWEYAVGGGAFRLYYMDEFLNGDYHYPVSDYYGEMSLHTIDRIPQRYDFPVAYAPVPMSVEIAQLRGADERTRLEFSIALSDSVKRSKGSTWELLVTFFDPEWNRYSRDHFTFSPDTLPEIERMNARYVVLNLGIELLPRELKSTCVVEALSAKERRKGTRRIAMPIRDMYGRSLRLSDIKFTIPNGTGGCSTVLDPIPSYRPRSTVCLAYEIYNLKLGDANLARYRLTYTIRNPEPAPSTSSPSVQKTLSYMWSSIKGARNEDRPYITSSIEQSASATTVSDNLQIDIAALDRGSYLLALEVEDLTTGMKATESKVFTVTE